jgi:hypothetical protein
LDSLFGVIERLDVLAGQKKTITMNLKLINDEGRCPNCKNEVFLHGPQGGSAENIRCAKCGKEYWFAYPFEATEIKRDCPQYYRVEFNLREELFGAWYLKTPIQKVKDKLRKTCSSSFIKRNWSGFLGISIGSSVALLYRTPRESFITWGALLLVLVSVNEIVHWWFNRKN